MVNMNARRDKQIEPFQSCRPNQIPMKTVYILKRRFILSRLIRIYNVCHSYLICVISICNNNYMSRFSDGKGHFINSGWKGLKLQFSENTHKNADSYKHLSPLYYKWKWRYTFQSCHRTGHLLQNRIGQQYLLICQVCV